MTDTKAKAMGIYQQIIKDKPTDEELLSLVAQYYNAAMSVTPGEKRDTAAEVLPLLEHLVAYRTMTENGYRQETTGDSVLWMRRIVKPVIDPAKQEKRQA